MSLKIITSVLLIGALLIMAAGPSYAKDKEKVSVVGSLIYEKHGQDQQLILHARNRETYHIKGRLIEELKEIFRKFSLGSTFIR